MPAVLNGGRIDRIFMSRAVFELTFRVESRFRLTAAQVFGALKDVVREGDIEELGRTDGSSWTITVASAEAATVLREVGYINVNDRPLRVTSVSHQRVEVRCHWLPSYIKDEFLKSLFSSYGKVVDVRRETTVIAHQTERRNGIRVLTLETDDLVKGNIPHLMRFEDGISMLITMPGRPPLCLRCHEVGHMRRDCSPVMQAVSKEAAAKRTYAQAAQDRGGGALERVEPRDRGDRGDVDRGDVNAPEPEPEPEMQLVNVEADATEESQTVETVNEEEVVEPQQKEEGEQEEVEMEGEELEIVAETPQQGVRRSWSDTDESDPITPGQASFFVNCNEDSTSKRTKMASTFELLCGSNTDA